STPTRPTASTPHSPRPRRPPQQSRRRPTSALSSTYRRPDSVGDGAAARKLDEAEAGRIFREESGRAVAALIRVFGDIDMAEDAVQEAFSVALRKWSSDGMPPNPGGWITTTARNWAIDRVRRQSRERELLGEMSTLRC